MSIWRININRFMERIKISHCIEEAFQLCRIFIFSKITDKRGNFMPSNIFFNTKLYYCILFQAGSISDCANFNIRRFYI